MLLQGSFHLGTLMDIDTLGFAKLYTQVESQVMTERLYKILSIHYIHNL